MIETTLDNGLTVLIRPTWSAPVVACAVGYRVGGRNEQPGRTGISHWVEHMTFSRTRGLKKGEIFRLTSRVGGSNNGYTTHDFTLYYETLPAQHLDLALRIEAERMAGALFDPDETERERGVILAERSGSENSPHFLLSEKLTEAAFEHHPYRWSVIGRREDLERLTRDELYDHYRAGYAPANAVLVVAGAVEPQAALEAVRRAFASVPAATPSVATPPPDPEPREGRRVELRRPGGVPYLTVCYRGPAFGHPDWYPLAVADAVLSGGKSLSGNSGGYMGRTARLYQALVETRLSTGAGSSLRCSVDPSFFSTALTLRRGADPARVEEMLLACTEGLADAPPTPAELERARVQSEAQAAYSRDGVTGQALGLTFFQLLGHWSDLDAHVRRFRAVEADEVAAAVRTYLRPERRTVGWFFPDEEATA